MATPDDDPDARARQHYTVYAARGRIYARNVDHKLIDLGELAQAGDTWRWRLDGNQLSGTAATAQDALRQLGERMGFFYIDGQFTAVADLRETGSVPLDDGVSVELTLEEPQPGERAHDASV